VSLKALRGDGVEPTSGLRYEEREGRWDLTVGAAENARSGARVGSLVDLAREALPNELKGLLPTSGYFGTATFETPQVAFAYERGWRDSFKRAGFPGPDEEARLAVDALGEFAKGGIVVDASCGSGLFTRRFLKTKAYKGVVALDYSDAMLRQAKQYMEDENLLGDADVCFVRADIARLPFPEGSLDGVHAGAAIHCWPDAKTGVAEIARVLKPGATFCGTTFMNPQVPFFDEDQQAIFDNAVREFSGTVNAERGFRWWSKKELRDLCTECGLVDFKCEIRNQFIFYSAKKRTVDDVDAVEKA
jgi:ubiquinone/menaquinone biosynthesis C-methylase UbiE